jgi:hypothetical protein
MENNPRYSTAAAFGWSVALIAGAFTVPVRGGGEGFASGHGSVRIIATGSTLVSVNGFAAVIPVAVPAVVSALVWLALHWKRSRGSGTAGVLAWVLVGLLWAFCLVGAFTIGLLVVPVAALLAYATLRTPLGSA